MKMSVESLLALEHPYYRIDNFKVFLGGEEAKDVLRLDTLGDLHRETGYVDRYVRDSNGNFIADGDEPRVERVYGYVEIKLI